MFRIAFGKASINVGPSKRMTAITTIGIELSAKTTDPAAARAALELDHRTTVGAVATLQRALTLEAGLDDERHRVRAG